MEKYIEILIFVAFAAFSLLSQYLTKKRKAATRAPEEEVTRHEEEYDTMAPRPPARRRSQPPRRRSTPPPQGPTSLEEILRELTGQPKEVEVEEEEDDYELPPYMQEKKQAAEAALPPTEPTPSAPSPAPQKLSDKISLKDDGKRIKPIKTSVKRRGQSLGASIAQSLRDPKEAKRAIILSEILQRKHF